MTKSQNLFEQFRAMIQTDNIIVDLANGLIGHHAIISGPLGNRPLLYADYVASGRALRQIEDFVLTELLPFYANSHTEASYVGGFMTNLRREARDILRAEVNASKDHAVIFTGSGATAGINRISHLICLKEMVSKMLMPVVLIGPYEHHSNILPWRESGAEVIEVLEAEGGGPCMTFAVANTQARQRPTNCWRVFGCVECIRDCHRCCRCNACAESCRGNSGMGLCRRRTLFTDRSLPGK